MFSFQAQAKNPPPGTGTSDIPANILIMIDNSGSMSAKLYSSVQVYYPLDVATDSSGNVYVMEYYNNRIKVFDSSGVYKRSFGGRGNSCNRWNYARQFTIYNDKIYIADTYNHRIVKLSLTGQCERTSRTSYNYPVSIAVRSNNMHVGYGQTYGGTSYITYHHVDYLHTCSNMSMATSMMFYPWGMSYNNNGTKLLISDYDRNKLVEFSVGGGSCSGGWLGYSKNSASSSNPYATGSYTGNNGGFRRPTDAAYDSNGNIYATDLNGHRIQKLNSSFSYQAKTGSYSTSSGFRYPYGMHIDSSDNIYVTDFYNYAVRKYDTSLTETTTYGGGSGSRLDAAKKVIKKIVSNTDLTAGANFGLMEWGSYARIKVKISDNGAKQIYTKLDSVRAGGGTNLLQAMNTARNYFTSGQVANWNKSCSQNYLVVISDGYWGSHSSVLGVANQINIAHNIKTFAVGFALGGANNNYKTLAQKGGTTSPLYADNETQLLAKLTDAIKQAISGRLTFTTPAVMSDVSKDNFIYQTTFEYEKNKQWKGSVKKYKLNPNGSFGAVQWDAADKLNSKKASSRSIWTAGISSTGTNNFTTSNRDELKPLLFPSQSPTNTEVDNLINFIRGVDTYDQDADSNKTESIHKLADIYHSDLIVVGAPEASTADTGYANFQKTDSYYRSQMNYNNFKNGSSCGGPCRTRTEVIIGGANNGILHAFKTSDGEELWGYIPPVLHGNFEKIPSSKANATNAIYGIDGSPVVKDIYIDDTPNDSTDNPRWRTVLISGIGAGGHGIFALDITDINNPKHLFAIENDPSNKVIKHWDIDGSKSEFGYRGGSILAQYDYRKLGETWSTPRIIRIKVNGKDKWVAVFGGGYNQAVNPNYGSAVFVMDIENEGRLLNVIDIKDKSKQSWGWSGRLFKRTGGILTNNNTEFNVSAWNSSVNFDISKDETLTAEFDPPVDHTITFSTTGNIVTVTKVTFGESWPNTPNGGPPKPDYGNVIFKRFSNDIVNSLPADLSVITADGTGKANYDGAMVYATDLEGKLTKVNLTENFSLICPEGKTCNKDTDKVIKNISATTLFSAESTSENGRYIYTRPEVTINKDNILWLYFGTGNTQKLHEQSNKIQNRAYGIKDKDFPNFVKIQTDEEEEKYKYKNTISKCKTAPTCPGTTDLGWYANLPKAQKLTAEPTVDKDRVYFPIYEPTTSTNVCNTGKAILTAYNITCGDSVSYHLGTGVLSKVVVEGDNLYIGIAGEVDKNISDQGFTSTGNLITGAASKASGAGKVQLEGWREN